MRYVVDLMLRQGPLPLASYALKAKTDDEATIEAEQLLRSVQAAARLLGEEPPITGRVVREGEVIARIGEFRDRLV